MLTRQAFGTVAGALFAMSVTAACQASVVPSRTALPSVCVAGPLTDERTPSREGFFREVLFAMPTSRTPRYDVYTVGSYHIDKLDLANGLPDAACKCGTPLDSVLVLGPRGLLWTYHVVAVLHDKTLLRVNSLVMPHARITSKATGLVRPNELGHLYAELLNTRLLQVGLPIKPSSMSAGDLHFEFTYDLLFIRFAGDASVFRHGSLGRAAEEDRGEVERLYDAINRVLSQLQPTYETPGRE
jgi:hypothetical protein